MARPRAFIDSSKELYRIRDACPSCAGAFYNVLFVSF